MSTDDALNSLTQISRVIAETASDGIITIDENSTILFANRATEKIFGYSRNELVGHSLTMLMPEYLRHVHRAGLTRYMTTGERHISWEAVELPGLHKNGSELPLELSFGELVEGGKRFFTGIVRDITDRKRAEEALRQSEEHFRALIENATDIITVLNRDGTRQYVSPSVERSIGYKPEELIGKSPFELIHSDNAAELRKLFIEESRQPVTREVRIRHKNGSWRIHEATAHNLLDDPAVNGIVVNSRDITDRKRLEYRLMMQYQTARILAESPSLDAAGPKLLQAICESLGWDLGQIWIVDPEAAVLRWLASWHNPAVAVAEFEEASRGRPFARGVGLPGNIWADGAGHWFGDLGSSLFTRNELASRAGLRSGFGFPIRLGEEVFGVMEFFTRDSETEDPTLLEVMNSIGNHIGQFIERKHAEEQREQIFAREQRARLELETAMNRMRQVQTVTEVALSYLSLDKLLAELLERVCESMDVDTVVILLREEDDHLVAWATKGLEIDLGIRVPIGAGFGGRVAAQKAPLAIDDTETAELYTPFLREHGVKCLLGVPLLIEGRVLGVIHVGRFTQRPFSEDDTRLLQLVAFRVALAIDNARLFEEERAARREAEAANRAKDEFLTTLSHELRTPLTPVIGWIHMVRTGMLPTQQLDHGLSVIEKNAHALKRLINDLLDMTAILSGKMRMEELPVHLGQVVHEAIETVRPFAATRQINVEGTFRNWNDEIVIGDTTRLGQVFANLLHNAVKFSPVGGTVRLTCETEGHNAVVSVTDEGEGIPPEFLPHVFEKFVQADGSKTRSHGGLGLGLALVKSFVESHGGTVSAESAGRGHGSRFTVRLTRKEAGEISPVIARQTTGPLVKPAGAHILIVEDDEDTLELLQSTFKSKGFRVTTCQSAPEALEIAPQNSIDLILSDIGMPHMDGFEMMKKLRELPNMHDVPAIALSGYATSKDTKMALAAGFNAHVSKPIEPAELLKTTSRLLKKKSETGQLKK
ncbi:MAG TPA: PAS domain S-box protein [Pyrinomonadaceae bacterium]|nr:PAS domain S-box protein [Pyrinomonadaceae bacterium]